MWAWLKQIVRNTPAHTSGPITAAEIARQIEAMLARQRADADTKDQEAWQWGHTGSLIRRATRECEAILMPTPEANQISSYLQRVLPQLGELAARYRSDDNDPDGYGLGTVREIEEAMLAMQNTLQRAGDKR